MRVNHAYCTFCGQVIQVCRAGGLPHLERHSTGTGVCEGAGIRIDLTGDPKPV